MRPKSYPAEESRTREYREKCKTDENRRSVRSFIQPASKGHANVSFFFVFFFVLYWSRTKQSNGGVSTLRFSEDWWGDREAREYILEISLVDRGGSCIRSSAYHYRSRFSRLLLSLSLSPIKYHTIRSSCLVEFDDS